MVVFIAIPSDDVILNALNHEIRREILHLLQTQPMGYSSLMDHFAISSGKLNYHLKLLAGFVEKHDDGLYHNTQLAIRVLRLLEDLRGSIQDAERPLLKQAYISQIREDKSYLHFRVVGGLQMKIVLVISIFALIVVMMLMYSSSTNITIIWPLFAIALPVAIIGILWLYRMYRPAKEFVARVERLLQESER
jgi:DNA-binding transcriptional ArsR family regulator